MEDLFSKIPVKDEEQKIYINSIMQTTNDKSLELIER